jgi:DNA mismatch endonuclease, patch repair protein
MLPASAEGMDVDTLTKERRSWNMSRIRGKDTEPEMLVRSALHRRGHRFRLHSARLPGRPDLVLAKHRLVIFVHGCFWHRHSNCKFAYTPKSRHEFWGRKFTSNQERDTEVRRELRRLGWNVAVIWECEARSGTILAERLNQIFRTKVPAAKRGDRSCQRA